MAEALSEQEAVDLLTELDTSAQFDNDSDQPSGGDDVIDAGAADDDDATHEDDAHEAEGGAEDGDTEEGEGGEEDPAAETGDAPAGKVAAPQWWDAEAKAIFEDVPNTPAARAYALRVQVAIAEHEAKRETVVAKAKTEAKAAVDASQAEIRAVRGIISKLDTAIPDQEAAYKAEYDEVDWEKVPAWAASDPAGYAAWHAKYVADTKRIESLRNTRAAAEKVSAESFARETGKRLMEINPELASSQERLNALGDYAAKRGRSEDLKYATADDLVILDKARAYDEMMAKAAAAPKNQGPKATPAKTVRPVAGQVQGTHKQRQYADAVGRVSKSGSDEDAIAAILAGGY